MVAAIFGIAEPVQDEEVRWI